MAYSQKEWEVVKAFFEEGLSLAGIAARDEVTIKDRTSICKKAKQQGWIKGGNSTLLQKEIKARQDIAEIAEQKSTLNATELEIHNTLVNEAVKSTAYLNKTAIDNLEQAMKAKCENQNDFKARADTILKAKETIFGKTPDTAIQINNRQTDDRPRTLSDFYARQNPKEMTEAELINFINSTD